ncbi:MAG: ThuA domain-containing protein [Gemmatimonadota bacterium]|nr:ThuA domain-containing protein [Gemmatimonadota bacterium]
MKFMHSPFTMAVFLMALSACGDADRTSPAAAHPHRVTYEGDTGPGEGMHVVLISGDHEYRSEEILPAMGRILARRYGFDTSVFFTLDDDGFIEPGSSNISGLQALQTADLMIVAIRFQDFPADEMQHIVDYLDRGGPVIGLRTATHAFQITDGPHARFSWDYEGEEYLQGFGEQVLGETWVGHYGTNHEQSSRLIPADGRMDHPILRGVSDMHVQSGGYQAYPPDDADVIALGQVLDGMERDASPDPEKEMLPVAWTRSYTGAGGQTGRVFTTTHGASEDFLDEGFRRMLINASLWSLGLEEEIRGDRDVSLVGPYHPVMFSFDGYRRGVRPSDMAGFETPIMSPDRPTTADPADDDGANDR